MSTPLGVNKVVGTAWKQSNTSTNGDRKMTTIAEVGEGLTQFDPIDVNGTNYDPTNIPAGKEIEVVGTFASVSDMERLENIESIDFLDVNINVSVTMTINDNGDPDFNNALNQFAPVPEASISAPPGSGFGGGFFGGGLFPGAGGGGPGGGGFSGGGEDDEDENPPPTPTPPPPAS